MLLQRSYLWVRKNLFNSPLNIGITIVLSFLIVVPVYKVINWGIIKASWTQGADYCRQNLDGACWGFIADKFYFLTFGFYPREEIWRGWVALALFVAMLFYSGQKRNWKISLVLIWAVVLVFILVLIEGTLLGLPTVESPKWGGFLLTVILAATAIFAAYPFGILLALGRTGSLPIARSFSIAFIEFIRGVPFISLLFMASLMLPLFLPPGFDIPKITRAIVAAIIFSAAYLAETVRGGLSAVPKGQYEAADSLGLSYWRKMGFVILPQALGSVIQPTIGSFISLFIDTSLVVIISMYDFLGAGRAAMTDPNWLGFSVEMYVYIALIYFFFCFTLSRYSRKFEREVVERKKN